MKTNKIQIEISRPVYDVFEFTTNPSNTHVWIEGIRREERDEDDVRVGTKYRNLNGEGRWTSYIVVAFEVGRVFELSQEGRPYHVRYTYEASGNGTKLTYEEWVEEGELEDPFGREILMKLKRELEKRT